MLCGLCCLHTYELPTKADMRTDFQVERVCLYHLEVILIRYWDRIQEVIDVSGPGFSVQGSSRHLAPGIISSVSVSVPARNCRIVSQLVM